MKKYLDEFEKEVLIKLAKTLNRKPEPVPIKRKKIHDTKFGDFIKTSFNCKEILAFDYYGLFKVSTKIIQIHQLNLKTFPSIKTINAPTIHFSSVKKEQVQQLAPHLYKDFNLFKKYLVNLRWNKWNDK